MARKNGKANGRSQKSSNRDVYQEVTDRVIGALEQGTVPWEKPWASMGSHYSVATGKPYRGVNQFLLMITALQSGYETPAWLTFRQAKNLGGSVRKGEHGTHVVFWKFADKERQDDDGNPITDRNGEPIVERMPVCARTYTVFNIEQCEGLDTSQFEPRTGGPIDRHPTADGFIEATGADIRYGGDAAAYSPAGDYIRLPQPDRFIDGGAYYATAFHELTHWTGHQDRCNRDMSGRFGDESYAAEELVAELGSAFLCAIYGAEGKLQHPQYIQNWIKVLKNDKKAVFTAASKAQHAVDFLLDAAGANGDDGDHEEAA